MSTLAGTDAFVVNRGGVNYQVTAANLMSTLADTDLFVVNRSGTNFKITGLDVKNYFGGGISGAAAYFPNALVNQRSSVSDSDYLNGSCIQFDGTYYYANNVTPTDPSGVADFTTYQGYQVSSDGCKTWSLVPRGANPIFTFVLVAADNSLIAAADTGVYRSTNQGGSWVQTYSGSFAANLIGRAAYALDPDNGKILITPTRDIGANSAPWPFVESSDNGQSWNLITVNTARPTAGSINGAFGYGGDWYVGVSGAFPTASVVKFPQGSTGTITATNSGIPAITGLLKSISCSRGLANNFFVVCSQSTGPNTLTFRTFDASTLTSISTTTSSGGSWAVSTWVDGENKMMCAETNTSSAATLGANVILSSTNGTLTNVSSLQTLAVGRNTNMIKIGADLVSPVSLSPYITTGWVL